MHADAAIAGLPVIALSSLVSAETIERGCRAGFNLDPRLARVRAGIHRLDGQLLVILDVDRVFDAAPMAE